jgi:RND family efflux transporter MFP subunit
LQERRSATTEELDRAKEALDRADAQLSAARARAAAAMAAQEAARSGVEAAGVALSYATLVAPFDGVVTQRLVDPGSMAIPGTPLLTIEDPKALRLEVAIDEARSGGAALGQSAESCFEPDPSQSSRRCVPGRVTEMGRLDPSSHSVVVKIDLSGEAGVRSGMFGRARFEGPPRQTITAPSSAVVRRGQLAFAFTVDAENRARLQPLSLGEASGDQLEVLSGLREGDRIVLDPPPAVSDGVAVTGGAG